MGPIDRTVRPGGDGRIFYGWWLVAAGAAIVGMVGIMLFHSYGFYVVLLRRDFGWSKTTLSAAYAMTRAESGMLGPVEGWLVDRFGPRTIMRIGIVMFGVGFLLFSRVDSLLSFYLVFFLMSLGATLGGWFTLSVALVNWFDRRRGTALAVAAMGFTLAGLAAPIVVWSLESFGWRATAFASGVLILTVALPLTQTMRHRPEQYGLVPDGVAADGATADGANADSTTADEGAATEQSPGEKGQPPSPTDVRGEDFTAREAMRTRAFWLLSVGHGSSILLSSAVMLHLALHLNEGLGYSLAVAGGVVALLTAMQTGTTLLGGLLADLFDKRLLLVVAMAGQAVALLMLTYATGFGMLGVFIVLYGLGWGIRIPTVQAIRADYFGASSYGTIQGFSTLVATVGNIIGPLLAGVLADRTGSYELGFTILAVAAVAGSVSFLFAVKPGPPQRRPQGVPPTVESREPVAPAAPAGDAGGGS